MIDFSTDPKVTASMRGWRSRKVYPTELGSAELRGLGSDFHLSSITSARTTSAEYLQEVSDVVDDMLAGKINLADGRLRLMRKIKELGYDPATGFPDDFAEISPAARGSLQDLSSRKRIDLLLRTNVALARNVGRAAAGNTPSARFAWPAWALIRIGVRHVPRGTPDSHSIGWQRRWFDAGQAVQWQGAVKTELVALKDSPIWKALADGEGGYADTLGHPFPPFAFNSGMDWRAVPRAEADSLGLLASADATPDAQPTPEIAPTEKIVKKMWERLAPDLRAVLKARWAE